VARTESTANPPNDLANFVARHSRTGLQLRYARSRLRTLGFRVIFGLIGTVTIAGLVDFQTGVLIGIIVAVGEIVETQILRHALNKSAGNTDEKSIASPLLISAIFQSVASALAAALMWFSASDGTFHAHFIAASFLVGLAINAGIGLPLYAMAAKSRLAIYGITVPLLFIATWISQHIANTLLAIDFMAVLGMFFMVFQFLRQTASDFKEKVHFESAMLIEKETVSEKNAALVEKERQTRRLAIVAEQANDSVIITGPDGLVEWVNDTFTKIMGYAFDEIVGQQPGNVLNSADTDSEALSQLVESRRRGEPCRVELLNLTKCGKPVWIEVNQTPVLDENGDVQMFISVERDITIAKEKSHELAAAIVEAENAAKAKSDFLATISHELRTPLNGIIGMADLLKDSRLNKTQANHAGTIIASGEALLTIINDILDVTKLDSGNAEISNQPYSPRDCVQSTCTLLRPMAESKQLAFSLTGAAQLPTCVLGDSGRLRQILTNLVGNAIKFTDSGSVTVGIQSSIAKGIADVTFTVTDTGIGIEPDRVEKVFDSFTQANSQIDRQFGGTGLGLTIARMLARKMGGDIVATSEMGLGSSFVLRLPMRLSTEPVIANVDATIVGIKSTGLTGRTVLVAEDNKTNRMLVKHMLEKSGLTLEFAVDGEQAVDKYKSLRPDAILMDVSMPKKDGLQATRDIRELENATGHSAVPIIGLTANAFAEDKKRCFDAGMSAFLTKPVRKAQLIACLQSQMQNDALIN